MGSGHCGEWSLWGVVIVGSGDRGSFYGCTANTTVKKYL